MQYIKIASRKSKLALWQSKFIKQKIEQRYPESIVSIKTFDTLGDQVLDKPLNDIGGKGLFTKELEDSMMEGTSDLAVHSLKDVPVVLPEYLSLGACFKREDPRDSFLSQNFQNIEQLPLNAIVGTTSLRRAMQLRIYRSDLVIKDLRGNVNTRINKLLNAQYDAIILAQAGINRLNLHQLVKYCVPIDIEIMIPAMGQASLAIECRNTQKDKELVRFLSCENTYIETTIERDFVRHLNGGCQAPIGVFAKIDNNTININAIVGKCDGSKYIKKQYNIPLKEYKKIGVSIAQEFINLGAQTFFEQEGS